MSSTNYASYTPETKCCSPTFFTSYVIYSQNCTYCWSRMFINSTRHKETINGKCHHFRRATCMKCRREFDVHAKERKFCFWGLVWYRTVDRYDLEF